jgi:hypothetical protein
VLLINFSLIIICLGLYSWHLRRQLYNNRISDPELVLHQTTKRRGLSKRYNRTSETKLTLMNESTQHVDELNRRPKRLKLEIPSVKLNYEVTESKLTMDEPNEDIDELNLVRQPLDIPDVSEYDYATGDSLTKINVAYNTSDEQKVLRPPMKLPTDEAVYDYASRESMMKMNVAKDTGITHTRQKEYLNNEPEYDYATCESMMKMSITDDKEDELKIMRPPLEIPTDEANYETKNPFIKINQNITDDVKSNGNFNRLQLKVPNDDQEFKNETGSYKSQLNDTQHVPTPVESSTTKESNGTVNLLNRVRAKLELPPKETKDGTFESTYEAKWVRPKLKTPTNEELYDLSTDHYKLKINVIDVSDEEVKTQEDSDDEESIYDYPNAESDRSEMVESEEEECMDVGQNKIVKECASNNNLNETS